MCNNGFGGGNCCWIIILLIIIWCFCGNNNWGGGNNGFNINSCCLSFLMEPAARVQRRGPLFWEYQSLRGCFAVRKTDGFRFQMTN